MRKLELALVDSMTSEKLQEIAADGVEVALDSLLSDGVIKDIPFVGMFYKSIKAAFGISEAIFTKKIFRFLVELKDIPVKERQEFFEKMEKEADYVGKVGERLIVIIDKLDDLDKPTLLGKLFKKVVEGKYTFEEFLRISNVIQKSFLPDLVVVVRKPYLENFPPGVREHLMTLGLVRMDIEDDTRRAKIESAAQLGGKSVEVKPKIKYELNILGEKVRGFLLECA